MNKAKLKICLVAPGYPPQDGGGIGTYSYNLALGLTKLGHRVYVVSQSDKEDAAENLNGVEVRRFKYRHVPKLEKLFPGLRWSFFIANQIEELDKKVHFDVIEFPNWEGVGFAYLLKKKRRPVVTRMHTPYFETLNIDTNNGRINLGDRFICWLEKKACHMSDQLVSSTLSHRDMMITSYFLGNKEVNIIPLGIQLVPRPDDRSKSKGNGKIKVLYVSRLEKRKGAITLVGAIPHVLQKFQNVEFTFIGKDRPHAPGGLTFENYFSTAHNQFKDKVKFLGFVSNEELSNYYRACDIFVVPSVYESFGLIYVEAMMHGKPVIGCKAGGIPEVVNNGKTGILIEPYNVNQLVDGLLRLLNDPQMRQDMGQNARRLCEEKFSFDRMASNTEHLYQKMKVSGNGR
ncbi:MAG: hypothetical protein A2Z88_10325 [Omnitrophica WOR_2 bacterium GWA2_47_8]|nr:MAG: hypothetical protein A2Z88_10325 [Omnitrophica WOR_2 bacterium GWA2_47_8]